MIRKKRNGVIPFGWEEVPDDPSSIQEVPEEIETLNYLRKVKDNFSLRKLAAVIKARHGRHINPAGMKMILNRKY